MHINDLAAAAAAADSRAWLKTLYDELNECQLIGAPNATIGEFSIERALMTGEPNVGVAALASRLDMPRSALVAELRRFVAGLVAQRVNELEAKIRFFGVRLEDAA